MHIKRYTIASFILIALIGWIGTFSDQTVSIDVFGVVIPPVSIAILVMVPLVIFYIASLFHIVFYSILGKFKLRKYEKDYEKMIDTITDAYLGKENRRHIFSTTRYKLLGSLFDNTTLYPTNLVSASIADDKISSTIQLIEDVNNNKVMDLKKYSLSIDNPLVIKNEKNRYRNGDISAEDMLSNPQNYNADLLKEIYIDFVKEAPIYAVKNYKSNMTKDALYALLSRVNGDENTLDISNEDLLELFAMLKLDSKDYLKISSMLSTTMIPEQRIKLFETISDQNDDAMDAYLFTLFDLEMLAPADTILEMSQPHEYLNFKAYRALKEHNYNFNINLFI
jgi:hypothetical protein